MGLLMVDDDRGPARIAEHPVDVRFASIEARSDERIVGMQRTEQSVGRHRSWGLSGTDSFSVSNFSATSPRFL